MKRFIILFLTVFCFLNLSACTKSENIADTSIKPGEIKITGTVEQVNGNSVVISDGEGGRYSFYYSDKITVVEDGYYVVDLSADSFKGKRISVICSSQIMETYPAMLSQERMIIIE